MYLKNADVLALRYFSEPMNLKTKKVFVQYYLKLLLPSYLIVVASWHYGTTYS